MGASAPTFLSKDLCGLPPRLRPRFSRGVQLRPATLSNAGNLNLRVLPLFLTSLLPYFAFFFFLFIGKCLELAFFPAFSIAFFIDAVSIE